MIETSGVLIVDKQEWTSGRRFQRSTKRRWEFRDRWRMAMSSGDYDEGFLSADDLRELDEGFFRYRGDRFVVEWLNGDEAEGANAKYCVGWD